MKISFTVFLLLYLVPVSAEQYHWLELNRVDASYKATLTECEGQFKKHRPNNILSVRKNVVGDRVLVKCVTDNGYQWKNSAAIVRSYDKTTHKNARSDLEKLTWKHEIVDPDSPPDFMLKYQDEVAR